MLIRVKYLAKIGNVISPLPPLRLSTPARSGRADSAGVLSTVARLVASGAAVSRADLVPAAGLARTTVSAAVDELLARGLLRPDGSRPTVGRGRPADRLAISPARWHGAGRRRRRARRPPGGR